MSLNNFTKTTRVKKYLQESIDIEIKLTSMLEHVPCCIKMVLIFFKQNKIMEYFTKKIYSIYIFFSLVKKQLSYHKNKIIIVCDILKKFFLHEKKLIFCFQNFPCKFNDNVLSVWILILSRHLTYVQYRSKIKFINLHYC